jgi:hypothetical protein
MAIYTTTTTQSISEMRILMDATGPMSAVVDRPISRRQKRQIWTTMAVWNRTRLSRI